MLQDVESQFCIPISQIGITGVAVCSVETECECLRVLPIRIRGRDVSALDPALLITIEGDANENADPQVLLTGLKLCLENGETKVVRLKYFATTQLKDDVIVEGGL